MPDDAPMYFTALVHQFPAVWANNGDMYCNKKLKDAPWQKIAVKMAAEWLAIGPY